MKMNIKEVVGKCFKTNEGYDIEVISVKDSKNCTIKFIDSKLIVENLELGAIKGGRVKNPLKRTICGVGYYGQGNHKSWIHEIKRNTICYSTWKKVIERCYSDNKYLKNLRYENVKVCEEWHNFQNFAEWFEKNYKEEYMKGWNLDKDLFSSAEKIYSPETCCFLPYEINGIIKHTCGIYKYKKSYVYTFRSKTVGHFNTEEEAIEKRMEAKKEYIGELIEKYKDMLTEKQIKYLESYPNKPKL